MKAIDIFKTLITKIKTKKYLIYPNNNIKKNYKTWINRI